MYKMMRDKLRHSKATCLVVLNYNNMMLIGGFHIQWSLLFLALQA